MLIDIVSLLILMPVTFILNTIAHELGHAVAGRLVGLTIHEILIATDVRKGQVKPRFTVAGTEFYLAPNSLLSSVTTSGVAFSQHPIKQIIFSLAGPLSGALVATVFAYFSVGLTGTAAVNVIALSISIFYIIMDLANLEPQYQAYNIPSDGMKIRNAWRQLRARE
ncbi:M50 family metallopeptidase (plasmid) [Hymenobacter tibetensis]|uniref:M50 family metallopeptidase n=1 Tax=Hymenobacter tibetensis TaxID=497967 RepID=A0ABY4D581_9BACT|nr:M50 family metallopeptidase [Hymenobacter tibetensis]UOG77661.1 M50 family metallopeptidase [Hymenobacter tibetensis]